MSGFDCDICGVFTPVSHQHLLVTPGQTIRVCSPCYGARVAAIGPENVEVVNPAEGDRLFNTLLSGSGKLFEKSAYVRRK